MNLPTTTGDEWKLLKEQAQMALKSGLLPAAIKTPEQAAVIALKGRELGLPIMQSLSGINVIQGKPCLSSELMLALIFVRCPKAVINYTSTTNEECIINAKRPGGDFCQFKYTIEDATAAGAMSKDNWRKFPSAMLRARCVSSMARALFPDCIMGAYTPDEMGAVVDEDENVIDVKEDDHATKKSEPVALREPVKNHVPNVTDSNRTRDPGPTSFQNKDPKQAYCETCGEALVKSSKKPYWYCPKFKDASNGKHTTVKVEDIPGWLEYQETVWRNIEGADISQINDQQ